MDRGTLAGDLQRSERFAWQMVVPGAFFLLAMWLPEAQAEGTAEMWGVCLGAAGLLGLSYFGIRGRTWLNRWVVVPVTIGVVTLICDSVGLLATLRQAGTGEPILLSG
ncbi:MAG: hypothetical protein V5A84_04535, partial [Planctomycetota bacterium]